MRGLPNLGRIFGVRIALRYTWLIAFVLITVVVATQFPTAYTLLQRIILGMGASLFFLLAIVIREFFLNFTAIVKGMPVNQVTIFIFGGLFRTTGVTSPPTLEILLAIAGLILNFLIAGIFYGIYSILVNTDSVAIAGIIQWLTFIFFMLALFHVVPGFPLDGGRLSRALLWKATGNYERSTRVTSQIGQWIGLLLIAGGIVLSIVTHQWFTGLVLVLVGWDLWGAATQSRHQAVFREALQNITAQDIMEKECHPVTPELSVSQLVQDCILPTGQRYFIVVEGDKLQGIVTMRHIKKTPGERWNSTRISEIMTPASKLRR
jgi:Zn-dependent protease